jgi:hypothetical protein
MTCPLATRGYIWPRDVPVLVEGLHPDTVTENLHPDIMSHSVDSPKVKIRPARTPRPSIRPTRPRKQRAAKGGR